MARVVQRWGFYCWRVVGTQNKKHPTTNLKSHLLKLDYSKLDQQKAWKESGKQFTDVYIGLFVHVPVFP